MKPKICGNCQYWKKEQEERNMGLCHFKQNADPKRETVRPVNKGMAIRFPTLSFFEDPPQIKVLFGRWFGCIYFKRKKKNN